MEWKKVKCCKCDKEDTLSDKIDYYLCEDCMNKEMKKNRDIKGEVWIW